MSRMADRRRTLAGVVALLAAALVITTGGWAGATQRQVEDGCGDVHTYTTVNGERVVVEDPFLPPYDIDTFELVADFDVEHPGGTPALTATMVTCAEVELDAGAQSTYGFGFHLAVEGWDECDVDVRLQGEDTTPRVPQDVVRVHAPESELTLSCERRIGPVDPFGLGSEVEHERTVVPLELGVDVTVEGDRVVFVIAPDRFPELDGLMGDGTVLTEVEAFTRSLIGMQLSYVTQGDPETGEYSTRTTTLTDETWPFDLALQAPAR